eukprot:4016454-Karenia_brevis.AAC.1
MRAARRHISVVMREAHRLASPRNEPKPRRRAAPLARAIRTREASGCGRPYAVHTMGRYWIPP